MRKILTCSAALVTMALALPALAENPPQKPGKWQVKMQMEMPGMPMKMPPVTSEVCITPEDAKDPKKTVPASGPSKDCTMSDYKIEGNKVTWTVDCPKDKTKGSGEITYSDSSYDGSMTMNVGGREMKTKYSGKWLGECRK